jgi:hypothetical protein
VLDLPELVHQAQHRAWRGRSGRLLEQCERGETLFAHRQQRIESLTPRWRELRHQALEDLLAGALPFATSGVLADQAPQS